MFSQFDISLEESVHLLKRVLPLMSERQVPTIPQNYAVWFEYVTCHNPQLRDQIDSHISSGLGFTPAVCRDLYETFFLDRVRAEFDTLRGSMREAVEGVLGQLADLEHGMDDYDEVLKVCEKELGGDLSVEQMKALVVKLIAETHDARAATRHVGSSLFSMSEELTELRVHINQLNRDSRTDALTGIDNRRSFNEVIARMTEDADVSGDPLSLIIVDIDHFKNFNDTHGHVFGDKVIRFVAQEMKQCVKGRDFISRFGGEEFAVLLPSTAVEGACTLAESIRYIIEAQSIRDGDGVVVDKVTISLGVAQYIVGESHSDFINRADAALYASKSGGRNRVTSDVERRASQH